MVDIIMTDPMVVGRPVHGIGEIDIARLELPPGVIRYRIRHRNGYFAMIYLRFADRTEQWVLFSDGRKIYPGMRQGVNKHGFNPEARG